MNKTVCMVFLPRNRSCIVSSDFPCFYVGSERLQFVTRFKYLVYMVVSSNTDDQDIQREIRNMFVRSNILLRRFTKCSAAVKTVLFRSFCLCMYDISLWKRFNAGSLDKLRSCYNKCVKIFFGYKRRDSLHNILLILGLPTFDTLLTNACATFARQWELCNNYIVKHLCSLTC